MKYSCCIFDLDGTLLDTLEDLKNAVNFALSQYGFPKRTADEVRAFIGDGIYLLMKRALPEGASDNVIDDTLSVFREYYSLHSKDNTCPYNGILELLECMKENGIKTGVVTNKFHLAAKALVNDYFGELITETLGQRNNIPTKPDPTALNQMILSFGCDKSEVLYFGDSDVDIITAKNAGIKSVGVTWGFRDKELLLKTGADFTVDTPEEINQIIG